MFRYVRLVVLLLVLATVAQSAWLAKSRATDWRSSLQVVIYPLNGDGSRAVAAYLERLHEEQFEPIETFLEHEARRYGIDTLRPVDVSLAPVIADLPPAPPRDGNPLKIAAWSLRMRFWAWRNDPYRGPRPQVKIFVLYHDVNGEKRIENSLGLEKGLIGVVHAFGAKRMAAQNNVVIAHELLHTLGASDKYDPATNLPRYPEGYAEPQRKPLYPQEASEIMGGRTAISEGEAEIPGSLEEVVVGPQTAQEINWIAAAQRARNQEAESR